LSAHEQRALNENLLPPKQQIALPKNSHTRKGLKLELTFYIRRHYTYIHIHRCQQGGEEGFCKGRGWPGRQSRWAKAPKKRVNLHNYVGGGRWLGRGAFCSKPMPWSWL